MASNGYLRTVRVGGFDKQDVLAYVDDLLLKFILLRLRSMTRTKLSNVLRSRAALRSRTSRARRNLRKR